MNKGWFTEEGVGDVSSATRVGELWSQHPRSPPGDNGQNLDPNPVPAFLAGGQGH